MSTHVKEMPRVEVQTSPQNGTRLEAPIKGARIWGLLRIAIGWVLLWSFLDKAFALGFSTGRNPETGVIDFFGPDAWINGASPTAGFLQFGVHSKEPFTSFYQGLAGATWVDGVYMLSLLVIGTALIVGIGTRLAAVGGILWMAFFYTASALWPEHNPFMDEHVIYAIALAGIAYVGAGRYFGLGGWWERTALVQRFPILK